MKINRAFPINETRENEEDGWRNKNCNIFVDGQYQICIKIIIMQHY